MLYVTVRDQRDDRRSATVLADDGAAVVAGWLQADGLREQSPNVRALAAALAAGDWQGIHAAADALSMNVEADTAAAELAADMADGWGLLGDLA